MTQLATGARESLARLAREKPAIAIGGALVLLAGAAALLIWTARVPQTPGMSDPALLRCASPGCGEVWETTNAAIAAAPAGENAPGDPGVACPKCGKASMCFAARCPNDGKVFIRIPYRGAPTTGPDAAIRSQASRGYSLVCPTCRWDYVAAEREKAAGGSARQ